jgi:hypothetical protein
MSRRNREGGQAARGVGTRESGPGVIPNKQARITASPGDWELPAGRRSIRIASGARACGLGAASNKAQFQRAIRQDKTAALPVLDRAKGRGEQSIGFKNTASSPRSPTGMDTQILGNTSAKPVSLNQHGTMNLFFRTLARQHGCDQIAPKLPRIQYHAIPTFNRARVGCRRN